MNPKKTNNLRITAGIILLLALAIMVFGLSFYTSWPGSDYLGLMFAGLAVSALALAVCSVILLSIASTLEGPGVENRPQPAPEIAAAPPPPSVPAAEKNPGADALLLLSLLQEKGRFVDFLMEDVGSYTNEQVGAAARVVHQGCRGLLQEAFAPEPVSPAGENSLVKLDPEYNAAEFRVVGAAKGSNATGRLVHKGWRATQVKLPRAQVPARTTDGLIIVPAEVSV